MSPTWQSWSAFAIAVLAVVAGVLVVSAIASSIVRAIARRREWANILIRRVRWPFRPRRPLKQADTPRRRR